MNDYITKRNELLRNITSAELLDIMDNVSPEEFKFKNMPNFDRMIDSVINVLFGKETDLTNHKVLEIVSLFCAAAFDAGIIYALKNISPMTEPPVTLSVEPEVDKYKGFRDWGKSIVADLKKRGIDAEFKMLEFDNDTLREV